MSIQDTVCGMTIRSMRDALDLTRSQLAREIGVSRQAVGSWETGNSYPKTNHLKALIVLAIKGQIWSREREATEIRALWEAAHQKVPLPESWLASLLKHSHAPHLQIVESRQKSLSTTPVTISSPLPRVDGSDALSPSHFYGREEELAQLSEWIVEEHARIISVLGMGGIGKSALAASLMSQISVGTAACPCPFEVIIFRSLRDAPALEILLDSCLEVFAGKSLRLVPSTLEQRLDLLLSHLCTTRTLIVLENLECLLLAGDPRGHFHPDFLGYRQLLHRVANTAHQSCLLITSREQPANLRLLAGRYPPSVHTLHLAGLSPSACKQILVEKDMVGTEAEQEQIIELCGGNPLALEIVTAALMDLFSGEMGLGTETVLVGGIRELLDEHFARLSPLEQSVLFWLAIVREPITLGELQTLFVIPRPLLEAVQSLHRRSLLERGKRVGSFTLRSVVLEYVTTVLITEAVNEIEHSQFGRLIEHALCLSSAREYVCQSQERLLLSPVLANLQNIYRGEQELEKQLLGLLEGLREQANTAAGYGPANLIALLRLLRGNLNGLNLSRLSVRGAYLQDVQMQKTNLSGS